MEYPFHSNASFLQPLCYNLKAFAPRVDQKLLATEIAREGAETEYRGSFSTAVSTKMTPLDIPSQPTYPSLGFFPIGLVHTTTDQKKSLGRRSVQGFVSNSTSKTRRFLRSVWSGQGSEPAAGSREALGKAPD